MRRGLNRLGLNCEWALSNAEKMQVLQLVLKKKQKKV